MPESTVLIVSTVADIATDAVVSQLHAIGTSCTRLNSEDLPFEKSATLDFQSLDSTSISIAGSVIRPSSIWYRRLRSPPCPDNMDSGIYEFCLRENRAALIGGLLTQNARWMSHPTAVWAAEYKPYQLRIAQEVGLRIPKTIVSNDPSAIRQAYREFGSLVVKPTRSGYFKQNNEEFSIFTTHLQNQHLESLDDAKWSPSIYQELIEKRHDIRVTCVGRHLFSAAIHSQTDPAARIDWRRTENPNLPHSSIELPSGLADRILRLMARLELEFGCLDFVLTPEGDYVFLEVNPSGQWLWLDDQLDLGISRSIAHWLTPRPGRHSGFPLPWQTPSGLLLPHFAVS